MSFQYNIKQLSLNPSSGENRNLCKHMICCVLLIKLVMIISEQNLFISVFYICNLMSNNEMILLLERIENCEHSLLRFL